MRTRSHSSPAASPRSPSTGRGRARPSTTSRSAATTSARQRRCATGSRSATTWMRSASPGAGDACRAARAQRRGPGRADDRRGRRAQCQQPSVSLPQPHGGLARRAVRAAKTIRRMLMRFATAALALAISIAANAQQFPTKTVRFISGVTPGAASDTMARLLAEKMTQTLGHPVIVENRLGAGGLVGAKYVADAEPDGHTIMMYASAFTGSTLLSPDVLKPTELQAVATVATIPTVMVTPPGKYKTVKDFVAAAKAEPGKLVCTDAGTGSSTHMAFERFRFAAGFEALNVHTKGPGEALTEVISGRADCYFALVFQAQKIHDAGQLATPVW